MVNAVVLLLLPVLTGLQATLWSQLVTFSRTGGALINVASAIILAIILLTIFPSQGAFAALTEGNRWMTTLGYLVVNIVVALLWIAALQNSSIAMIGFVEIGYPLFILLFAYLLVGNVEMSVAHWTGAGMIFVGTIIVVMANHR